MTETIRLVVALAAVLTALAVTGPARGEDPRADHRPCVSNREFNSLKANTYRRVVEARWEVAGEGVPVHEVIGKMVAYPWCGHGSTDYAYVAVQYRNGGKSGWRLQYDCRWDNAC